MEKKIIRRKIRGGFLHKGSYGRKWFRNHCFCKPVYVCKPVHYGYACAPVQQFCFPTYW